MTKEEVSKPKDGGYTYVRLEKKLSDKRGLRTYVNWYSIRTNVVKYGICRIVMRFEDNY